MDVVASCPECMLMWEEWDCGYMSRLIGWGIHSQVQIHSALDVIRDDIKLTVCMSLLFLQVILVYCFEIFITV